MSYFVSYVQPGTDEPADGDIVASGTGWLSWLDWAIAKGEEAPCAAHLADEGWLEPAEAIAALEQELTVLASADAPEDIRGVTAHLLDAVRERPAGCVGILVTDGTPGEEEDDGEEAVKKK